MKFSDIVQKDYKNDNVLKVKNFFKELLNAHVEVRLRVLDPRINLYSIYVHLTNDMVFKLTETFEKIEINKNIFSNITTINSSTSMGVRIYNI